MLKHENKVTFSLSPREIDCIVLMCAGYTTKQIAAHLGISNERVEFYLKTARAKFGCTTSGQLAELYWKYKFAAYGATQRN